MIDVADAAIPAAPVAGRWKDLFRPQYAFATITLCLGVGLFAFDAFFVSTALPSASLPTRWRDVRSHNSTP